MDRAVKGEGGTHPLNAGSVLTENPSADGVKDQCFNAVKLTVEAVLS